MVDTSLSDILDHHYTEMQDKYNRTIGHNIRAARLARGMLLKELAVRTGINKDALSILENGHRTINGFWLYLIILVLEVDPRTILPDPQHIFGKYLDAQGDS